ncbi:MAG: cell division protein FtsL [Archangium sp.]|nr:cell division protein FtsL [Archangium sp.]
MSVVTAVRSRSVSTWTIASEIFPAALTVALLAVVGIIHVTSRVMVVRVGYELSRLDAERTELTRSRDQLTLELATLKSPTRLESVARTTLGLVPPAPSAITHLTGNR